MCRYTKAHLVNVLKDAPNLSDKIQVAWGESDWPLRLTIPMEHGSSVRAWVAAHVPDE